MNVGESYNEWAEQYDNNNNKTRDLEAVALTIALANIHFNTCLEIGCGTGKNTVWLLTKAKEIMAVDLSEEMLAKAKQKIASENVIFLQADILQSWDFVKKEFDIVIFSLVLEHIESLDFIFNEAQKSVAPGGYIYIGELHPFKQYGGSKARFDTENGQQVVTCFNHHISDFTEAAKKYRFEIMTLSEYFDDDDKTNIPRVLSILFKLR
jgi:ubiquinone/menaquinone biosynthesis C-methylase UbiE